MRIRVVDILLHTLLVFCISPALPCSIGHFLFARLFSAFAMWMDDENLQNQDVYLPSLPKQYDTHRLATIMQGQQVRSIQRFSLFSLNTFIVVILDVLH